MTFFDWNYRVITAHVIVSVKIIHFDKNTCASYKRNWPILLRTLSVYESTYKINTKKYLLRESLVSIT